MRFKIGDTVAYIPSFTPIPRAARIDWIDRDDFGRYRVWGLWDDDPSPGFMYMDDDLILVEKGHGACPMTSVELEAGYGV